MINRTKHIILKQLVAFIIVCLTVSAADYNVNSVKEFKSALKQVLPGDNIVLTDGVWKDAEIIFEADGTPGKPITLKAQTPGQVILTGNSSLKIAGDYLVVDGLYFKDGKIEKGSVIEFRKNTKKVSNYSRLTNTAIENYNPDDINTDYKWVSLYGQYNRVDHCYFRNKTHSGCLLVVWLSDKPNYHIIDSNYFAYRPELGFNGGEIIRVGTSDWSMYDSHTTVEYNYFEECNGEREIISNKSCKNVYRYNTFVASQGALTLRHGNDCLVEGNFFLGKNKPMTGGVRIIGENHRVINNYFAELQGDGAYSALSIMNGVPNSPLNRYFQVKNAYIANNTFVNNKTTITIGEGADDELSLPPIDSKIANNIVYSKNSPLVVLKSNPVNFDWEANIFYGAELGIDVKEGIIITDPAFKFIDNDDLYRVQNNNPAVKRAGINYDLIKQRPLKPEDVGTSWHHTTKGK